MLELEGIVKTYPREQRRALDAISLRIAPGERVAVLGRSGAGKSTLIRCINRLVEPDAGVVRWNGRVLTDMRPRELRQARSEIGMVFQHFNLLPRLSVLTNVLAGRFAAMPRWRSLLGLFAAADRAQALAALEKVELAHLAARRVEALSGGQKQRVAIARVVVQQPKLLLGDEPIASLDTVTAGRILELIGRLQEEQGLTVVLNLHDVAAARAFATRIIGLTAGRVSFDGPPEALDAAALGRIYPQEE